MKPLSRDRHVPYEFGHLYDHLPSTLVSHTLLDDQSLCSKRSYINTVHKSPSRWKGHHAVLCTHKCQYVLVHEWVWTWGALTTRDGVIFDDMVAHCGCHVWCY